MKYPSDMDPECIKLCDALNALDGITTAGSCCGHGDDPFIITFHCTSFESLSFIASEIEVARLDWGIRTGFLEGLYFVLAGPVEAYEEADLLAEFLTGRG